MIKSKITMRWLKNSFGVIVAIILIICIVSSIAIRRYSYNEIEQTLENRADIIANTLQQYSRESSGDFNEKVKRYVAEFEYRERMELMIIDDKGTPVFTSSGFSPEEKTMPDYLNAMEHKDRKGKAIGTLDGKEKTYLISLLNPVNEETSISAIRLGTSLSQVDKQITGLIISIFLMGFLVLGLVLFSSYYFIDGIIKPIGRVGDTARRIAQGDFNARLETKYDDEIGELANIINYMAGELNASEQIKNDFISSVSHELRTPLTAIQGWAETIKIDEGQNKEFLEKGMNIIIGETHRLSDMVEELLDFSRMQSGRLKLIKAPVDIISELEQAVEMYTQRAQRENIKLTYEQGVKDVVVYGDKNRLRQVFINIIDNAIKYSDSDDSVNVSTMLEADKLFIIIRDTGIGISEKDLPQIKRKFYKANSIRRGSGIGLAVAEEIVTRHDGELIVDSIEGEGTTITIILPIHKSGNNSAVVEESAHKIDTRESERI